MRAENVPEMFPLLNKRDGPPLLRAGWPSLCSETDGAVPNRLGAHHSAVAEPSVVIQVKLWLALPAVPDMDPSMAITPITSTV